MPFHQLAHLANSPLLLRLIYASDETNLSLACFASVFQAASKTLPTGRLQLELVSLGQEMPSPPAQICLLLADLHTAPPTPDLLAQAMSALKNAQYWGAAGAAVLWLAQEGCFDDMQTELAWPLHAEIDARADLAQLTLNLYEFDRQCMSCCGGAACLDMALNMVLGLYGHPLQSRIKDLLHIEQVRSSNENQKQSVQTKVLPPKLTEVLALMQANIEEPLSSDDLANLVDISRRQLERLFKQYLGNLPSRYYLELRLQKARQLLLESHHSIVQIGLMCGFSSGSHFSTAFSALFGITPREERQRKMNN